MNPLPPVSGNCRGFDKRTHDARGHRLLIADKERLFAEALRHALVQAGLVVDVATSPSDALAAARARSPELVILGAGFADEAGVSIYRAIVSELPDCRVIVLVDDAYALASMEIGIDRHGIVSKAIPASQFVSAIEDFLRGYDLPPIRGRSVTSDTRADHLWNVPLTGREQEVLHLLVVGATSEDIATRLGVKANTARKHVQNVLTKLQVHSRLEAVTVAIRSGIVKLPDMEDASEQPHARSWEAAHLT
jgi:two-component system, NarL family, nitrate/nitrite response regulator NarL